MAVTDCEGSAAGMSVFFEGDNLGAVILADGSRERRQGRAKALSRSWAVAGGLALWASKARARS